MTTLSDGVGSRVKQLRAQHCPNESGRKFAERAGINYVHLSKIENGKVKPQLDTLDRIAQALGVKVGELLGDPSESSTA